MAIYHFSAQVISRSAGRSSTAAAAYRAGEVVLDERTGETHDYTRKRGVIRTEIIAPHGSPSWVFDRSQLWSRVELGEKRKDSQVCREIEISIPHELTILQGQLLMIGFLKSLFVSQGMVADVAFHRPGSKGDNRNFHAHVMLTMRKVDGEGFGQKERSWNSDALLLHWREQWAIHANRALEQAGHDARIDHRSHAERGIEDLPGQHHGPAVAGLLARGEQSHMADRVAEQAAAVMARQVLDAQAAAELLRRQALLAEDDVQREMEAEWIQAELAQEAEDQAEREAQFEQLAAEQAAEDAAAAAAAAEEQAKAAVARAKAAQAVQAADAAQERAQAAVDAAERTCLALRPAYDAAISEQRQAGAAGLLATARALPKAARWQRAIDAYHEALQALKHAQKVLQRAGKVLAAALAKLEILDPAVRERREAREAQTRQAYQDQQRRIAEASAAAAARAAAGRRSGRVAAHQDHHQVQDDQGQEDQEMPT